MKILLYVDPSERGAWAQALAREFAAALKGTVLLLTNAETAEDHPGILERARDAFGEIRGVEVEARVREGRPRQAILDEARTWRPALIVLPPAGRRGLVRMIKGSRVRAVVHDAPSTVLVARQPVSDHVRSILVTVSGGPMSETTALAALEIAHAFHAQITLLHVSSSISLGFGDAERDPERARIEAIRDLLARGGVEPRMRSREGMVVNEIFNECRDGGYDLLILGQHLANRETGSDLSENIAEDLALHCPIPVLVVRPRRWADEQREADAEVAPMPAR
jgi:nucleotide-binding universal stress UspA family protein